MDGSVNMNSIRLVLVHALVDRRFPLANGGIFSVAFLLVTRSLRLNPRSAMTSSMGSSFSSNPVLTVIARSDIAQSKGQR